MKSSNMILAILGVSGVIMVAFSGLSIVDNISDDNWEDFLTLIIVLSIGLFFIYISLRYGVKKIDRFLSR
jgi:hypothetical protein